MPGWKLDRVRMTCRRKRRGDDLDEFLAVDPGKSAASSDGIIAGRAGDLGCTWKPTSAHRNVTRSRSTARLVIGADSGDPRRHRHGIDRRQLDSKVLAAPPALHTMRDLPLPSFFPGPELKSLRPGGLILIKPLKSSASSTLAFAGAAARAARGVGGVQILGGPTTLVFRRRWRASDAIRCGRCGHDIALTIGEALRTMRASTPSGLPGQGLLPAKRLRPNSAWPSSSWRRDERGVLLVRPFRSPTACWRAALIDLAIYRRLDDLTVAIAVTPSWGATTHRAGFDLHTATCWLGYETTGRRRSRIWSPRKV
jgi:hypothetical protein